MLLPLLKIYFLASLIAFSFSLARPPFPFGLSPKYPLTIRQIADSVPTTQEQPQNITSTEGSGNGTSPPLPGFIPAPSSGPVGSGVNCSDLSTGRSNSCWEELELTNYVIDWAETNECYSGEAFASCFLRKNGYPGLDCTGIKISACTSPQGDNILTEPKIFYVVYNIYAINQFFYSWWTAIGDSSSVATDNIDAIVQLLDPASDTQVVLQDVFVALQGGIGLVPGPLGVIAAVTQVSWLWQSAAQVITNAMLAAPNVGRFLFPVDSAPSQLIQMADLSSNFAGIIMKVQSNLNETLVSVMSNVTEFLAFAKQGNFTASAPSLPDQTNYLYYAFNTYLISMALQGNGISSVGAPDTNVMELVTNGTETYYPISCSEYDAQGVCDAFWYSSNLGITFTLDDFNHMNRNYGSVMSTLFQNWTSGELLFEGAYACNAEGNYGKPINITVNAAGVNTACVSQLQTLSWNMSCTNPHGKCEFDGAPPQNSWCYANQHHTTSTAIYSVPAGYLGPLLSRTRYPLRRN